MSPQGFLPDHLVKFVPGHDEHDCPPSISSSAPLRRASPPPPVSIAAPPAKRSRKKGSGMVMDPFEVRIRFHNLIVGLNASVTSSTKAAQFALKYRDMAEDLHSCILESLEEPKNTMNNRANIMYFVEHLCDMATREKHVDYVRMIQRDIIKIVDTVVPEDGSGAANVKVVRKVLQALGVKGYLQLQTVSEIDDILKDRDTASTSHALSSPVASPDTEMYDVDSKTPSRPGAPLKVDKKVAEQRIEEDRERHKRLRENIWAVPAAKTGFTVMDAEFDQLWDETSDLGEDDYEMYREEAEERTKVAAYWAEDCSKRVDGTE